jgi:hypothetical protein
VVGGRHTTSSVMPICGLRLIVCVLILGAALSAETKPEGRPALWSKEVPNYAGLAFLDNTTLLLYGVERSGDLSSRESPEISSAFRLQVALLDIRSGKPVLSESWGTRLYGTDVQVTAGGVLVKTGGILRLYSLDFRQFRDLPITQDPNASFFINISASGKTIMVSHYFRRDKDYISHIYVLDAATLKVRYSWDQYPALFVASLSDNRFAEARGGAVSVTEFGSANPTKVIPVISDKEPGCAAGVIGPKVISDSWMLQTAAQPGRQPTLHQAERCEAPRGVPPSFYRSQKLRRCMPDSLARLVGARHG